MKWILPAIPRFANGRDGEIAEIGLITNFNATVLENGMKQLVHKLKE
jgi:hypothetical protein